MNVVVLINGRDAIPVRALPFVVPSNMSPDVIVTLMGRADECGRFDELFAYQLPPHGCPVRVQPSEWSRIACKIMAFHDWIKKDEESGAITKSIGLEKWKDDSIRLLPAGVFVWKDEFISEHRRDYIQGQVSEDEYKQGGYDPNFEPLIYPERLQRVVMKGFEHLPSAATPDQTSPMHGRESPGSVSSTSATDLPQSVINAITVGYSDLLTLCSVDDEDDFGGYVVKKTGVYVKKHNKHGWGLLTPSEKAVLAWHPTGEYDKPALALPCTLEELRAFVSDAGLAGCIDEEALQEIVELRTQTGDEIAQMLAGWFDSPIDDLPPKQRRIVELYIPSWQELSAADRRARAAEAYLRVLATRGARIKKASKKAEAANAAIPARFADREFQDGFNRVQRTKNGERDFEAKRGAVNLSHERCIELAHSRELRIADWIELTGVGHGWCGAYLITKEGVIFREWDDDYISASPLDWQSDMERDNEQPPLKFPCTPIELLHFVDTACHDLYGFSVPNDFRQTVIAFEQATDTAPQVPDDARGPAASPGTAENAVPADMSAAVDEKAAPARHVPAVAPEWPRASGATEKAAPEVMLDGNDGQSDAAKPVAPEITPGECKQIDAWIIRAREIAKDIWLRELNVCKKPAKERIAPEIAARLWRERIVTKRNKRVEAGYIVRFALGKGWSPPEPD